MKKKLWLAVERSVSGFPEVVAVFQEKDAALLFAELQLTVMLLEREVEL